MGGGEIPHPVAAALRRLRAILVPAVADLPALPVVEILVAGGVSGRGKVFSFVTFHRVYHPAFEGEVPYVVALIELEEGPRLLSNVVGIPVDQVRCEMPVKVVFDDVASDVTVPKFTPA